MIVVGGVLFVFQRHVLTLHVCLFLVARWSMLEFAFVSVFRVACVKCVGLIAFVSSRGVCLLAFVSSLGLFAFQVC